MHHRIFWMTAIWSLMTTSYAYQSMAHSPLFSRSHTKFIVGRERSHAGSRKGNLMKFKSSALWKKSSLFSVASGMSSSSENNSKDNDAAKSDGFLSKRVLLARILLTAVTFGTGYKWGLRKAVQGMVQKHSKDVASGSVNKSSPTVLLLTTVIALLVFRDGWRSLPSWMKPNIVKRAVQDTKRLFGIKVTDEQANNGVADDENNITDFGILGGKFRALTEVAERRMPEEEFKDLNIQVSFFALLRLLKQQKANRATTRDERYEACGSSTKLDPALVKWMDLADAAYDERPDGVSLKDYLDEQGYDMIKYDKNTKPGYLGHYVALDKNSKTALIGIKGTSNLEDLITDMVGAATSFDLDAPFVEGGPTSIRAHDGILLSSRRLTDDLVPLIKQLILPQGYKIVIVGHSLGAAASALLAVLLRSRLAELRDAGNEDRLQVYAFASPPTLDRASAEACEGFVTTIVNNCDVIPRCNAGPVLVTMQVLKAVNDRLLELNASKKVPKRLLGIRTVWSYVQAIRGKEKDEEPPILSAERLAQVNEDALEYVGLNEDDPDQLFVAGRVLLMFNRWENEAKYNAKLKADLNKAMKKDNVEDYDFSADGAIATDPTAKILRFLEFDGRMVEDHMAPSYKNSLRALCAET